MLKTHCSHISASFNRCKSQCGQAVLIYELQERQEGLGFVSVWFDLFHFFHLQFLNTFQPHMMNPPIALKATILQTTSTCWSVSLPTVAIHCVPVWVLFHTLLFMPDIKCYLTPTVHRLSPTLKCSFTISSIHTKYHFDIFVLLPLIMHVVPEENRQFASKITFRIFESETDRNSLNNEQRSHGPYCSGLSVCTWRLSLLHGLSELSTVNHARLSECGESDWCGCLYKGKHDSRGGNANDLYGQ